MPSTETDKARVNVNAVTSEISATIEVPASPERVYRALASRDVVDWWVRPGVFDTREWAGDVRVGGAWRASGIGGGKPYTLHGEFLAVDSPRGLIHTWHLEGSPGSPSTVAYDLVPHGGGTHISFRHSGFTSSQACEITAAGWQTSFDRLVEILTREAETTRSSG
jgi:uncharacterized protein YndB with AHSA1/START domain